MKIRTLLAATTAVLASLAVVTANAHATLTVDEAVRLALQKNSQVVNAQAGVLDARSGAYMAWTGIVPRVTGSTSMHDKTVFTLRDDAGNTSDVTSEFKGPNPTIFGSWNVLNLSSITSVLASRRSQAAATQSLQAARNDVAFQTRRQFYEVVKAIRLSLVADSALRLARDDERRVRALFEVGSVSKNDLLRAQVRTAQAELDSLVSKQSIVNQRNLLATAIGAEEAQIGDVDTTLTKVVSEPYEMETLVREAAEARPDIRSAELSLSAARTERNAARLAYLPYISGTGSWSWDPNYRLAPTVGSVGDVKVDRSVSTTLSLNLDIFNGFAIQSGIASARAREMRARDTRDLLVRNLRAEVRQSLLLYEAAVAGENVARRSLDAASEGLKLAREKYNVGSATILDLIDAQVSLVRSAADLVSALAAIRVAEADLARVRGRAE